MESTGVAVPRGYCGITSSYASEYSTGADGSGGTDAVPEGVASAVASGAAVL